MGTVVLLMLLAWLICTAAMTLRAGTEADPSATGTFATHIASGAPAQHLTPAPAADEDERPR